MAPLSPVEPLLPVDVEDVLASVVSGVSSVVGVPVVVALPSSPVFDAVLDASLSTLESVVPGGGEESAGTHAGAYEQEVITAIATA